MCQQILGLDGQKSLKRGNEMSTLKVLKKYLVGESGYLLNDDNNGKTVMLSGTWGSGKTHFWLEDIKPLLSEKKQKNIYISLYGRESISELKFEVLKEAYNLEVKDDIISKSASMLSTIAPSLGEKSLVDSFDKLNKKAKEKKAEEILKSGSIICLDDFERKSKNIDLNDLFGYISQLALDYNCKVVIILNSDVFEGEEANVFKTVKEKTVNKFFYFEPERRELFDSIYDREDNKYENLDTYKEHIFNAIDETEELNARIYIQVLDNCLEWVGGRRDNFEDYSNVLIWATVAFFRHNLLFQFPEKIIVSGRSMGGDEIDYYSIMESFPKQILSTFGEDMHLTGNEFFQKLLSNAVNERYIKNDSLREYCEVWVRENKYDIEVLWKYGYRLLLSENVNIDVFNEIYKYLKLGILASKDKESS